MIKKIIKEFNIMLFIPIMMIACVFINFEKEDNSFLLEYYKPAMTKWVSPSTLIHESNCISIAKEFMSNLITSNNIKQKEYKLAIFLEQKRIEEEQRKFEEEQIRLREEEAAKKKNQSAKVSSVSTSYHYNNNQYFTDEQIARIPNEYTLEEVRMFCTMVYGECGAITGDVLITYYDEYNNAGESFYIDASYMHKLTASVLYNRMKHKSFPDTIYGNLVKKNQYTELYTYESQSYKYYSEVGSNWYNVVNDVLEVLNEEFDIPNDVIFQSNFSNLGSRYFASIYVDTGWFRSMSYYAYD